MIERKYLDMFERLQRERGSRPLEPLGSWFARRRRRLRAAADVLASLPAGAVVPDASAASAASRPDHRLNRAQLCPPLARSLSQIARLAQMTPIANGLKGLPAEIRSGPNVQLKPPRSRVYAAAVNSTSAAAVNSRLINFVYLSRGAPPPLADALPATLGNALQAGMAAGAYSLTSTKCLTLCINPRVAGVSLSSTV